MTIGDWWPLIRPVAGMGINAVGLMISLRVFQRLGYIGSVVLGFVLGLLSIVAMEASQFASAQAFSLDLWARILGDFALYGCLAYLFFTAINIGESSIRVRILREVLKGGSSISEKSLLQAYDEQTIVQSRLDRMLKKGLLVRQGDRYILRSRGLLAMASIFRGLKIFLTRRTSEFE